jgi:hypothetical protein
MSGRHAVDVERMLDDYARLKLQDAPDPTDLKAGSVTGEFTWHGLIYRPGAEIDGLPCHEAERLVREGKLSVSRGGWCNRVVIQLRNRASVVGIGFRGWQLNPGQREDPDEFARLLVPIRLLKQQRQIFAGNFIFNWNSRPWTFLEWALIRSLGYGADGVFEVCDDPATAFGRGALEDLPSVGERQEI